MEVQKHIHHILNTLRVQYYLYFYLTQISLSGVSWSQAENDFPILILYGFFSPLLVIDSILAAH